MVIFAMLGSMMFASKKLMEFIPNVHLLALFIVATTVVFRWKALYPLYIYILLDGVFLGFSPFWVPYLYIWAILWGAAMLLPKKMPLWLQIPVYALVCGLHGILFGVLWAPAQAVMFHLSWGGTLAWSAAGFPFDLVHGISDLCFGLLVVPLVKLLRLLSERKTTDYPQ